MTGFQTVTAVTISGAFVFGMLLVLLGSLQAVLAKRFELGGTRYWVHRRFRKDAQAVDGAQAATAPA